jgi:uncharacterized protein YjbJ (UPF0337 family)
MEQLMLDQAKGIAKEVVGRAQDAYGAAAADTANQVQGKVRQAAGKAQRSYGDAISSFREAAVSNPAATLAVVAGIGFVLGMLWSRRD